MIPVVSSAVMMNCTPLCCGCRWHNPGSLSGGGRNNSRSVTSLRPPWTSSSLGFDRQEGRTLNEAARRRCNSYSVAACSNNSSQLGLGRSEAEDVERTRKQIFEDGFAIFPRMWSKAEVAAAGAELTVGREQEKVLKSFLMDPIGVHSRREWLHASGHCCTDAAISPEPYWHHSWQIAAMEGEVLQTPPWSATLVVSLSARNSTMFCGGVAVFPRSHWIVYDRIANSPSDQSSFPQPCDIPTAAPIEMRLGCGDMALLHPLLAYSFAPNVSSSPSQLLVLNLGDATSNQVKARVDEGEQMWSGWHSMANFLTDQTTSVEVEMVQLQAEEGKAQLGGWQNTLTGLPIDKLTLATSLRTRTAPRDLLAWRLRNSAVQFMQDGQWSNALSMLQRRAGLRPTCYWTALQAGRCCMKSAPAGQLGGRAGRKCMLEDGERFLLRAIEIAPGWPLAYAELMRCLALMGRGREQEIPEVMEMMKQRCELEQLCLRYATDSDMLKESWNDCEALCHRYTSGGRL